MYERSMPFTRIVRASSVSPWSCAIAGSGQIGQSKTSKRVKNSAQPRRSCWRSSSIATQSRARSVTARVKRSNRFASSGGVASATRASSATSSGVIPPERIGQSSFS